MSVRLSKVISRTRLFSTTSAGGGFKYNPGVFINQLRYDLMERDERWKTSKQALIKDKDTVLSIISANTAISAADRELSDIERDRILNHFLRVGVDEKMVKEAISKGENANDAEVQKILTELVEETYPRFQKMAGPYDLRALLITNAIYFAIGDGLNQKEKTLVNEIAIKLGWTQQKVDRVINVFEKEKALFDEYYEIYAESNKKQH